jgi:hypothetical protein
LADQIAVRLRPSPLVVEDALCIWRSDIPSQRGEKAPIGKNAGKNSKKTAFLISRTAVQKIQIPMAPLGFQRRNAFPP